MKVTTLVKRNLIASAIPAVIAMSLAKLLKQSALYMLLTFQRWSVLEQAEYGWYPKLDTAWIRILAETADFGQQGWYQHWLTNSDNDITKVLVIMLSAITFMLCVDFVRVNLLQIWHHLERNERNGRNQSPTYPANSRNKKQAQTKAKSKNKKQAQAKAYQNRYC